MSGTGNICKTPISGMTEGNPGGSSYQRKNLMRNCDYMLAQLPTALLVIAFCLIPVRALRNGVDSRMESLVLRCCLCPSAIPNYHNLIANNRNVCLAVLEARKSKVRVLLYSVSGETHYHTPWQCLHTMEGMRRVWSLMQSERTLGFNCFPKPHLPAPLILRISILTQVFRQWQILTGLVEEVTLDILCMMWVQLQVHMCAHMHGGQRTTSVSFLRYHPSFVSNLYIYFMFMRVSPTCLCALYTCITKRDQKRAPSPWNWSYRLQWAAIWVLGTQVLQKSSQCS